MSPDSADVICISVLGCIGRDKAPGALVFADEGPSLCQQREDENPGCLHAIGGIGRSYAGTNAVTRGLTKTKKKKGRGWENRDEGREMRSQGSP